MEERLQKILARAGVASRRAAEQLILQGKVRVNGQVVSELGARANAENDRIEVEGRTIGREEHVYFMVHKPRGMVTTLNDPEGRPSLSELLRDIEQRVYPVGRLDFHTSGALLLTNDGDLAQALLHPSREVPKTYVAKLNHKIDDKGIYLLRSGVTLDDGYKTGPASVVELRAEDGKSWLELTITEGKNRQIHRMIEAIGARVMRLSRLSFAGITSEGLRPGQIRPLVPDEIFALRRHYLGLAHAKAASAPKLESATAPGAEPVDARKSPRGAKGSVKLVDARKSPRGANASAKPVDARKSPRDANASSKPADARNSPRGTKSAAAPTSAQNARTQLRKKADAFDNKRPARHKKGPT